MIEAKWATTTMVPTVPGQTLSMTITSSYLTCETTFTVLYLFHLFKLLSLIKFINNEKINAKRENPDYNVIGLVAVTGNYNSLFPAEICSLMICTNIFTCSSTVLSVCFISLI